MSNSNNTWNLNNDDELPDNLYVSPPSSPMPDAPLSGRNSFNAIRVNKFKKNFNKRWNNEHPSDPVHVNEYVPIAEHNYAANIAAWKTRNTTKNKTYKTRANYNANSRANLRAQLAQINPTPLNHNNSAEVHSAQYWQNKRAANAAAQVKAAVKAPPKWATVSTGKLIRSRKNRKSRKSRKNRK